MNAPEAVRKAKKRYCGTMTMAGFSQDGRFAFQRHRCKGYNCGICGKKKLAQARKRIAALAGEHGLKRMVTLTLDPKKLGNDADSIAYIRDCWRKMRVYLKRWRGRSIVFISVLELQPNSGLAHLHLLVDAFIPKDVLSAAWHAVGGDFTNIRAVDVHRVAGYIAKYLTKPSMRDIPDGIRRFTCSKGLRLWPRSESDGHWDLLRASIDEIRSRAANVITEQHSTEPDGRIVLVAFTSTDLPLYGLSFRIAHADTQQGSER